MEGFELDSCGSGYGQVAGIGENGKEVSRSIKCKNYSSLGEDPLTSQAGLNSNDLFGKRQ
jgi:hypothetical protein